MRRLRHVPSTSFEKPFIQCLTRAKVLCTILWALHLFGGCHAWKFRLPMRDFRQLDHAQRKLRLEACARLRHEGWIRRMESLPSRQPSERDVIHFSGHGSACRYLTFFTPAPFNTRHFATRRCRNFLFSPPKALLGQTVVPLPSPRSAKTAAAF